ncbi:MAG: hypothetical protein K1X94_21265 [Sandaracinaceae bacterium]|nr:hypothetical protein [Sandaracinaceae bacterium]
MPAPRPSRHPELLARGRVLLATLRPVMGPAVMGLVLTGLALMGLVPSAHAYDRQVGLFATAGYTGIVGDTPYPPHAVTAGLGVGFGLDDVWELRVRTDYAAHVPNVHRMSLSADLVYLVDVLSAVPYLGISAGGALSVLDASLGLGELRGDFLAGALGGLDVLLGREWTLGVELRLAWVLTDFDREPMQITGLARLQALFEL